MIDIGQLKQNIVAAEGSLPRYSITYLMTRWVGWIAKSLTLSLRSVRPLFSDVFSPAACIFSYEPSVSALPCWTSTLSSFDLSLVCGGKVIAIPSLLVLRELVLVLEGVRGEPEDDCDFLLQVLDLHSWKNCPATLHHATMAASISFSHAMNAADTPQVEGSSMRP